MKKICIGILLISISMGLVAAQLSTPDINTSILTPNVSQTIDSNNINDPIRDGAFKPINDGTNTNVVGGILNNNTSNQITDYDTAKDKTADIIARVINYALSLLALIALAYLIYHGFLILTAAGEEEQYKKGLKGVKYAAIALAGVGLSWFIVALIFYLIRIITGP